MHPAHHRAAVLALVGLAAASFALPSAEAATQTSRTNAAAQSDLRNLAIVEEVYLTDYDHYGSFTQLAQGERSSRFHVERGITLAILHVDGSEGYCLAATTSTRHYVYDSGNGGLSNGSRCHVITHGRAGGERSGPTYVG